MKLLICTAVLWLTSLAQAQVSFEVYPGSGIENEFDSHVEAEQNFYHCKKSVEELTAYSASQVLLVHGLDARLNQCLAEEQPAPPTACGSFVDGGNGAVWKPSSESNPGQVVFLLPASYCDGKTSLISNVRIVSQATGLEVADSRLRHCGTANQNRLHWNVLASSEELALHGPLFVLYEFNGGTECRQVPNPKARYD